MAETRLEKTLHSYFPFGFHLSRKSWDDFDIPSLLEGPDASKAAPGTYAIRRLADRLNEKHQQISGVFEPIQAGQLISLGVIVDVLRYLVAAYCHEEIPGAIEKSLDWISQQRGPTTIEQPPRSFVNFFPPAAVARGQQTADEYLQGSSPAASNSETVSCEIVLLSVAVANPAFRPFVEFFDDVDLKKQFHYLPFVDGMEEFFNRQPTFGPLGMTLFECLHAPMRASPDSLHGQLNYMRERWAGFLPRELLERLMLAADILEEEKRMRGWGPGPNLVLQFVQKAYGDDLGYSEPACFSQDADWMSNVVIIAKTVYVWLDQLSKRYQRHIRYLSDIPDEELDRLARWGFTGLWLIGLWERSTASQKIKQIMGNPEAAPSAYSLYDYVIAEELGGETAYQNLRDRARQRGIRLASDMVPNHVGIYSRWVIEHPDWFLQSDFPPYPSYQFTGVDLSPDPRVTIQIEDGYWEHRDAAVIFKRTDQWTGDAKYIYHGNDGTSTPWNDTAQLNFTLPEVREAVIQTILHVARKFPILRFDAAMTLAKKHYQRLWFPQHGDGGAIPSRAEHGMSKAEFDAAFPREFWREVVDRVAREVPDTLLLAEAFWLMEGYFVRTLGMHRVYNSAFMNMLKMEDNCKYRMTVKNVLEFSPEVLKRFVNFMNNPDEDTAIAQFGKDNKYFGVAVLMVTMPGLPMFGHGQIEGFTEKYGMEYRRAYWNEQVDEEMVRRHESEIFPLMRRRRLFSGAENFAFYDFNTPEGWVDENVFAYSNRAGDERAIILYNNAYNTTRGRIDTSTPMNIGTGKEKFLVRRSLAEALALNTGEDHYYTFRDHQTGFHYLRAGKQIAEEGIFAELRAYQYHAFLDFREIHDTDGSWARLARRLNGTGVPNLDEAYREMQLDPVLIPFREVLNADMLRAITTNDPRARPRFQKAMSHFLAAVEDFTGADTGSAEMLQEALNEMDVIPLAEYVKDAPLGDDLAADLLSQIGGNDHTPLLHIAVAWIAVHHLGRNRLEEWLLRKVIFEAFRDLNKDEAFAHFDTLLVEILTAYDDLLTPAPQTVIAKKMQRVFEDPSVRGYLQVNRHNGIFWLNKEQLERMMGALLLITTIRLRAEKNLTDDTLTPALETARQILTAADRAAYQVEKTIELLSALEPQVKPPGA